MPSRVILVVIVLISTVRMACALKEFQICTRAYTEDVSERNRRMSNDKDVLDKTFIKIQKTTLPHNLDNANETVNISQEHGLPEELLQLKISRKSTQIASEGDKESAVSGRGKQRMDRLMLTMLFAHKMKFMALIPTLIGSLILLFASNALVGFFFALFAAVVSMKGR